MPHDLTNLPTKLDFEGPHNFRDMGGYPVGEGRTFKSGLLYRSDHLGTLTDTDQGLIAEIGIRTVVDFRGPDEHNETPDNIADPAINQIWLPIASEGSRITELRRRLEAGLLTIDEAHEYLIVANRNYIVSFGHVYKEFTALLLDPASYPLVFHCTAGKDRAGFAAVLSLMMLGATKETVFHDYMATNHCTSNYIEGVLAGLSDMPASKASPEAIRTLMRVEPEFLQTALDTIDEHHTDFDTYLREALGVGPDEKARLVQILCDSV
jgi:protein-tyrosine phosphatase